MEKEKVKMLVQIKAENVITINEEQSVIFEKTNKNHKPLSKDRLFQYIRNGHRKCQVVYLNGHSVPGLTFIINEKAFAGILPNAVECYYGTAYKHLNSTQNIEAKLLLKQMNAPADISLINDNDFEAYIQNKISGLVLICSTLDAFINSLIPEDAIFPFAKKEAGKHVALLIDKKEIEGIELNLKVQKIVKYFTKKDIHKSYPRIYLNILRLIDIRNRLICLQKRNNDIKDNIQDILGDALESDLEKFVSDVKSYINIIKPGTISIQ